MTTFHFKQEIKEVSVEDLLNVLKGLNKEAAVKIAIRDRDGKIRVLLPINEISLGVEENTENPWVIFINKNEEV